MKRSEGGFATVFIALTLVAMLAASAMAIDLGQGFTNRRQMQNASDAAAMAGARQLIKSRNTTTGVYADPTNLVWTTVRDTAVRNGADTSLVTCTIIRKDKSAVAPCSPYTGWVLDTVLGGPAGVKVVSGLTQATVFGKAIGQNSVTARATANAMVEPLNAAKGAPFLVCGLGNKTLPRSQWPLTKDPLNPDLVSLTIPLLVGGAINPLAVGHVYGLQGSGSTIATCGTEAAFDGKSANGSTPIQIPSWQTGTNGNGNDAAIYDTVAGAVQCVPPNYTNCDLVLPIADAGATGYQLHIVTFGLFRVTGDGSGNPKYAGRLWVPTAPITKGVGLSGQNCTLGQICALKLVN